METSENLYFLNRGDLVQRGKALAGQYQSGDPFPHIQIDDFFPVDVARRIGSEFPKSDFAGFIQPDNAFQKGKLGRTQENYLEGLPPFVRHMLNEFNGLAFIDFLEALTGIKGLIPDTHYKGGALHQILPGGSLAIHADFNRDLHRKLRRRVNVLFYFNDAWDASWGGNLELWDRQMTKCEKSISPLMNRCVIFNTTSDSFHGHPDPLNCPPDRTRKSIALYYYTSDPDEAARTHTTLWRRRPGVDEPEGEGDWIVGKESFFGPRRIALAKHFVKSWTPPALWSFLKKLRRRS
ncbi:2OG-Fe(II) oxygenase [bacterium]|nr:2OG-Fe(II) oxygenase [bacterium]